jgi:hypothetical protein
MGQVYLTTGLRMPRLPCPNIMRLLKRAALVALLLLLPSATLADEQAEKRQLVSELLEVIDARVLMRMSFDNFMNTLASTIGDRPPSEDMTEEDRAEWEARHRKEEEKRHEFQERLFTRVDYPRYFDEVYVPMFVDRFTADELRELIAFFRTGPGQKLARVLPQLGIGTGAKSMRMIDEAAQTVQRELAQEEAAKHPWRKTMADLRSLATAVEMRATDENRYPNVRFEELEALIVPTYIREVPKVDSWGTPYLYVADGEHYRFVSAGADRRFEWGSRHLDRTRTEATLADDSDADIIFQDGTFLQSPREAGEQ